MASVHKLPGKPGKPGKPNWICFYYDSQGRRRAKSTKTRDKREAQRICVSLQTAAYKARNGKINADNARKIIDDFVREVMEAGGGELPSPTIREHFTEWLKSFALEAKGSTVERYTSAATDFLEWLKGNAAKPLSWLSSETIERYRNACGERLAAGSVNLHLKVIRRALRKPTQQGMFTRNPAGNVDNLADPSKHERRPFTPAELKSVLAVAPADWKTAVLCGAYLGLRLSDVCGLTRENLNLAGAEIKITPRKTNQTGKTLVIPIAAPLLRHLEQLPASDNGEAALMPSLHDRASSSLSQEFHEVLATAGLIEARPDKQSRGKGRGSKRQLSSVSFHSLRYNFVSGLKSAGASDAIAQDLAGHQTRAISAHYTVIDASAKRAAVEAMPDFTK